MFNDNRNHIYVMKIIYEMCYLKLHMGWVKLQKFITTSLSKYESLFYKILFNSNFKHLDKSLMFAYLQL